MTFHIDSESIDPFLKAMSFVLTPGVACPERNVFKFLRGNLWMGRIFICDLQMKTLLATTFVKPKAVTGPEKVSRL